MWFFLIKSIVGAILGQATNSWFKKTKMGMWFYKKIDSWYNWAAKRYDLDVLTKEEKLIKKFPALTAKICLLYTSPSPRDGLLSRMPSSA